MFVISELQIYKRSEFRSVRYSIYKDGYGDFFPTTTRPGAHTKLLYTSWVCLESLRSLPYSTVDPRYDLRPRFFSRRVPASRITAIRISAGMASSARNRPTWLIHTRPSHQIRRTSPKSRWQSEQKRDSGAQSIQIHLSTGTATRGAPQHQHRSRRASHAHTPRRSLAKLLQRAILT